MKRGILIDPRDNVGIVLDKVFPNERISIDGKIITALEEIDIPHKIAVADIKPGDDIIKYGAVIGYATDNISIGQHVHIHNVDSERMMK